MPTSRPVRKPRYVVFCGSSAAHRTHESWLWRPGQISFHYRNFALVPESYVVARVGFSRTGARWSRSARLRYLRDETPTRRGHPRPITRPRTRRVEFLRIQFGPAIGRPAAQAARGSQARRRRRRRSGKHLCPSGHCPISPERSRITINDSILLGARGSQSAVSRTLPAPDADRARIDSAEARAYSVAPDAAPLYG